MLYAAVVSVTLLQMRLCSPTLNSPLLRLTDFRGGLSKTAGSLRFAIRRRGSLAGTISIPFDIHCRGFFVILIKPSLDLSSAWVYPSQDRRLLEDLPFSNAY